MIELTHSQTVHIKTSMVIAPLPLDDINIVHKFYTFHYLVFHKWSAML